MCGIGLLAATVGKAEQLTQFGPLAANSGEAHEKTQGRPKFSCPPRGLQAARIRAPFKLPQGSLEPRASSPSGGLTRTRQVWGRSQTAHIGTIGAPRLMRVPQKRHFLVLHQNLTI